MEFLRILNLNQTLSNKKILNDISLNADLGNIVALLGPNGAGKTTLLRTTIGLLKSPKHDEANKKNLIFLDNEIINKWPIYKRIDKGLVYLPQHCSLFSQMTVLDNLKLIYKYHNYWKPFKKEKFRENMLFWLEKTQMEHSLKQLAGNLSGGQKRKLEVIRSILMHPKMILLDEPFAGVDPKSIYELKKIFQNMAQDKIAVLISDHNVDQLLSIADKIYVIINGEVITSGDIKEIMENDYTKEMYFGRQFYSEMSQRFLKQ
ncbi:MAG: ATP-binding cassette domain-containing protein [bacterium]